MSEQGGKQGRFQYLREGEGVALLLAVPPLTVAVLAQLLFEISAYDLVALGEEVASHLKTMEAPDLAGRLALADGRVLWTLAVFLHLTAGLGLTGLAVTILCRSISLRGLRYFVPIGVVLIVGGVAGFALAAALKSPISGLFSFTYDSLMAMPGVPASFLVAARIEVVLLNVLSIVAPVSGLMAACSTLAPPRNGVRADLSFLASQVKSLKALVVIGSIYMVTGVLHLGVWLRWPGTLVDGDALASQIHDHAMAMSLYWGGAFSVLIAAFYAPAMVALNRRAGAIIAATMKDSTGGLTPRQFLEDHGLSLNVSKQLPQIVAVLAPLLAGPIGAAVVDLARVLPGAQ
ncbi:MAG: hypothetical protein ACFCUQ_05690 [Kiloniellales bacterium]